jgi:alpha-glucosidase
MNLRSYILILPVFLLFTAGCNESNKVVLSSPDGRNILTVRPMYIRPDRKMLALKLKSNGIMPVSQITINLSDGETFDFYNLKIKSIKRESFSNTWINNFGERKEVPDNYNQAIISLENDKIMVSMICRAYNEGVAFSFEFPEQKGIDSLKINDECITYKFLSDYMAWSAPRAQALYSQVPLSKIDTGCERPLVIEIDTTHTIALGEAKLIDYARMKFEPDTVNPNTIRSRLDGEAVRSLPFQTPWRYIMTGSNAGNLLENNYFVLNLNDPCKIEDTSWIRPGKALREVTLTTEGAKAAIDFTSGHNMQYVEFDAGWYGPENNDLSDARAVNLDPARSKGPLDLNEVIDYANSKNIGIILYVNRRALEKQLDELLPIYTNWGIAGIKFGFVQVGSQKATRWLHESIIKVADHKMIADVHDEYRTTGFSRTCPNFLTMEGIRGDEESPSNSHTLITMFTRMLAGQADNTICYYNERVDKKMGSHASQLAKAVCLFSPLQFLYWYDKAAPTLKKDDGLWGETNYTGNEPELEFFNNVPTVWDETKVLSAKIGEYGIIARRKGDEWFIGGINGDKSIIKKISFTFLDKDRRYMAKIYSDDPTVKTRTNVRSDSLIVDNGFVYSASLRANNGLAIHLRPLN